MTTPQRALDSRWLVVLLAALTAVLALLLPATPASATAPPAAETRVGAPTVATAVVVGVHECITAVQRPVRGPSQPQVALGNCVAAEAAPLVRAANDQAYTGARHLPDGRIAARDLARGREAHVFADDADLALLEQSVWTQGTYGGSVRGWDRFTWTSETPIGWRVQAGRTDVPLHTVEIKGREVAGTWTYHLVPRTGPAR